MRITENEKKDLFDRLVKMADETLADKDFGRFCFVIELKDGVPMWLGNSSEVENCTRTRRNVRVEK